MTNFNGTDLINFEKIIKEESYLDMSDEELFKAYEGNIKNKWKSVANQLVYDVLGPNGPKTEIKGKQQILLAFRGAMNNQKKQENQMLQAH